MFVSVRKGMWVRFDKRKVSKTGSRGVIALDAGNQD